jgi:hypothetical protein
MSVNYEKLFTALFYTLILKVRFLILFNDFTYFKKKNLIYTFLTFKCGSLFFKFFDFFFYRSTSDRSGKDCCGQWFNGPPLRFLVILVAFGGVACKLIYWKLKRLHFIDISKLDFYKVETSIDFLFIVLTFD